MGSIDRRIEALEKLYGKSLGEEGPEEVARRREEFKAELARGYGRRRGKRPKGIHKGGSPWTPSSVP